MFGLEQDQKSLGHGFSDLHRVPCCPWVTCEFSSSLCVDGERHAAEHPCRPPLGRLDLHEGGPPLALAVVPLAANGRGGSPSHVGAHLHPTDDGNSHKNIYHFEDECGTVSEGRMCGPWYMTQEMSPTLAWCTRSLPSARLCSSQAGR